MIEGEPVGGASTKLQVEAQASEDASENLKPKLKSAKAAKPPATRA
jgi:hypothetical protein